MKALPLLAVAVAIGLAGMTGASFASSGSQQVLRLLDVHGTPHGLGSFHFQHEPRAGDATFESDGLYAWTSGKRGARLGRAQMTMTSLSDRKPVGADGLLLAQLFLPTGSIFVEGIANLADRAAVSFPILGGTGAYAATRGYVAVLQVDQNSTGLVLHFR